MSRMLVACSGVLKFFVRLDHIRKCFTQKGGIFVLEEYNPKTRQVIQRRYKSLMVRNKRDSREEWSPKGPPPQDATDPYSDGCPANCPSSSWWPRWTLVVSTACHGYELQGTLSLL
uniref:MAP kinase-activating death domain-containing protein n=1 Tax=Timema douglasi TaxID=61478 RepID=A0A7R8VDB7_TIMDO|nr:unnamed protein product [Timema douglasi]